MISQKPSRSSHSKYQLSQVAAAKGLIAGHFTIVRKNGSIVDYTSEFDGHLIPNTKEIQALQLIDIRWILIIEKEVSVSLSLYKSEVLTAKGDIPHSLDRKILGKFLPR